MMFQGKKVFNASFDAYADDYHEVRPGYPDQMFNDIKAQCGITGDSKLLEIGAGSGIATKKLAEFGCKITALEPGSNLARIARKHTSKLQNVEIIEDTFESFQPKGKFDTVLAFTAFHWVPGNDKYGRAMELLNDSGSLVIVWNSFLQDHSAVTAEVNEAYDRLLPTVYGKIGDSSEINKRVLAKLTSREREIFLNDRLYPVFLRKYTARYNYDDKTYPQLLNTFPKIVGTEDSVRSSFLREVSGIIKRHEMITVPVLTTVVICRRRESFLRMTVNEDREE
ncbi:MAG: class I SAM-dependent methyltransferase [Patescibacteria group bacterium]|nr:class I SAM-dependent methyltransferase [Patescibacteria group bacterium]MDE1971039.1 class I SAM-dependent methyltransferase [Patescibacteria group bacterium]